MKRMRAASFDGLTPLSAASRRKVRGMLGRASRHTSTLSSSVTCAGDTALVLLLPHGRVRAVVKGLHSPTCLSLAVSEATVEERWYL